MDTATLQRVSSLCEQVTARRSASEITVFAHIRVERSTGVRDYLIGSQTDLDGPVAVLHWRNAPLSRLLYEHEEGSLFELQGPSRLIEGRLVERHLVHADRSGRVHAIEREGVRYERRSDRPDQWIEAGPSRAPLSLRDERDRARPRTPVDVTLDPAQRAAVERPMRDALLVLGEAGAGKTTVALHRVAHLDRVLRERNRDPLRVLVVAPTEGLRRLLRTSLDRLHVRQADVVQFDRWAAVQARRAFERIPARAVNFDAPMGVLRVKRSRAMRAVIAQYAAQRRQGRVNREDLHELFGDRALLASLALGDDAPASSADIELVARHTRAQFRARTEDSFASVVDATRLHTADGMLIDEFTPDDLAGRIDAEDAPVLFELARAVGQRFSIERYDCIVVDEAQELAPMELALIGDALVPGGSLIVAGDASQQVDATSSYESWSQTLNDLRAHRYATVSLETSYRCPPEVTALARSVLDPASDSLGAGFSQTDRTRRWVDPSEPHQLAHLCAALRALRREDRNATVVIIAKDESTAERWHPVIAEATDAHLARGGDFIADRAAHVCAMREVKGLEFDYVFLLDASASNYPNEPRGRHALYVAITRATHSVVLGAVRSD